MHSKEDKDLIRALRDTVNEHERRFGQSIVIPSGRPSGSVTWGVEAATPMTRTEFPDAYAEEPSLPAYGENEARQAVGAVLLLLEDRRKSLPIAIGADLDEYSTLANQAAFLRAWLGEQSDEEAAVAFAFYEEITT